MLEHRAKTHVEQVIIGRTVLTRDEECLKMNHAVSKELV